MRIKRFWVNEINPSVYLFIHYALCGHGLVCNREKGFIYVSG